MIKLNNKIHTIKEENKLKKLLSLLIFSAILSSLTLTSFANNYKFETQPETIIYTAEQIEELKKIPQPRRPMNCTNSASGEHYYNKSEIRNDRGDLEGYIFMCELCHTYYYEFLY